MTKLHLSLSKWGGWLGLSNGEGYYVRVSTAPCVLFDGRDNGKRNHSPVSTGHISAGVKHYNYVASSPWLVIVGTRPYNGSLCHPVKQPGFNQVHPLSPSFGVHRKTTGGTELCPDCGNNQWHFKRQQF